MLQKNSFPTAYRDLREWKEVRAIFAEAGAARALSGLLPRKASSGMSLSGEKLIIWVLISLC